MTNVPLALGLATGEITVLLGITVRAFGADSRLRRDRGDAVKRARAAREALLLERVGRLIEEVRRIKGLFESYTDALFRADWTDAVRELGELGIRLGAVDKARSRLLSRWRALSVIMVVVHVAAPGFLLNNILDKQVIPDPVDLGCAWLFAAACGAAVMCGLSVRQADLAFERCLEEGSQ